MGWAHVGASIFGQTTGVTVPIPARAFGAAGNLVIVGGMSGAAGATLGISDTQTNTWTQGTGLPFSDATNALSMTFWWALAKNTASTTITVTSTASAFLFAPLDEFSGNASSPADQVFHSAAGLSGNPISQSFTPSVANDLVWLCAADSVTAIGNINAVGATKGADDTLGDWSEYTFLNGGAGVSMTAAFVGSGAYGVVGGTFKLATGSAPSPHSTRPFPFKPSTSTLRGF